MTLAWFAAESADPTVPGLVSYGGVGILALALLWAVRELWAREKTNADHHRERADKAEAEVRRLSAEIQNGVRADKAEAEVKRLNAEIQSSTLPAVVKSTEVMAQLLAKTRQQRGPS